MGMNLSTPGPGRLSRVGMIVSALMFPAFMEHETAILRYCTFCIFCLSTVFYAYIHWRKIVHCGPFILPIIAACTLIMPWWGHEYPSKEVMARVVVQLLALFLAWTELTTELAARYLGIDLARPRLMAPGPTTPAPTAPVPITPDNLPTLNSGTLIELNQDFDVSHAGQGVILFTPSQHSSDISLGQHARVNLAWDPSVRAQVREEASSSVQETCSNQYSDRAPED